MSTVQMQQITDDGDLRRYRTEIPNMADDELDPYQYRLYAHYKRVCGAAGGMCYESVRTTAELTKMSVGKVVSTRDWLADEGWITVTQTDVRVVVRVTDRWSENCQRYAPAPVATTKRAKTRVHLVNSGAKSVHVVNTDNNVMSDSVHGMNESVHHMNAGVHLVNTKERTNKELTNEEGDRGVDPHTRDASPLPPSQPQAATNGGAAPVQRKGSPHMRGLVLPGGYVPAGQGVNPVQVYYERFHFADPDAHLTAPVEDDLIRLCPDLDRLREVVIAYSRTTFKRGNVQLILDWYRDGVPVRNQVAGGTNGNGYTSNGRNGNGNGGNAGGRAQPDSRKPWANYVAPEWSEDDYQAFQRALRESAAGTGHD